MYGKCHGLEANCVRVGGGNLLFDGAFTKVAGGISSNGARGARRKAHDFTWLPGVFAVTI